AENASPPTQSRSSIDEPSRLGHWTAVCWSRADQLYCCGGVTMRYVAMGLAVAGTLVFGALLTAYGNIFAVPFAACAGLTAIGVWDMLQTRHSLRRNYPILANIRFGLEMIRPEIRQYLLALPKHTSPSARRTARRREGAFLFAELA